MRFGVRFRVCQSRVLLAGCLLASLVFSPQAICLQTGLASDSSTRVEQNYQQGVQSLRQEQWKAAVSAFQEALKLDPRRADAENGLGAALGKLGDQPGSQAAFRRAIAIDPGYAEAHYNLALWLRESGDIGQALSELDTAIKLRPDYEAAQLASALILQQSGQPDKAISLFKAVLQQDPRSAETHNWLGVAYAGQNHLLDSIAEFQQAVDLSPDDLEASNNLASALAKAKRFDQAASVLRSALKQAPKNVQLRLNLSRVLRAKGSVDAALTELKAILKDSDNPDAECEIAEILGRRGDFRGAIEASEKALALNPGMGNAYQTLGLALRGESQSATHVAQAKGTPHHEPSGDAKAHYDPGRELLSKGDIESAQKEFEKAVEADPNWAEAHNLLGFVLGQLGDLTGAIDHLHKAV
jgi:protein O-GlcNAc transferase